MTHRNLRPCEVKLLDSVTDAVIKESQPTRIALVRVRHDAMDALHDAMKEVYRDPEYWSLVDAYGKATDYAESRELDRQVKARFTSRIDAANHAYVEAVNADDDAMVDDFNKGAEAACVAGEMMGFRVGYLLGYRMCMGLMPDAGVDGFGEFTPAAVAAAMIDDGIARDMVDSLIEMGALDGLRRPVRGGSSV